MLGVARQVVGLAGNNWALLSERECCSNHGKGSYFLNWERRGDGLWTQVIAIRLVELMGLVTGPHSDVDRRPDGRGLVLVGPLMLESSGQPKIRIAHSDESESSGSWMGDKIIWM